VRQAKLGASCGVQVPVEPREVPAVSLGIIEEGMTLEDILRLKGVIS
jgi:hypothetical protein